MLFTQDTEAELQLDLHKFKNTYNFKPRKDTHRHDKYLVMSCLQKSVRRGDLDHALYAAFLLKSHNDNCLWNRLKTIALEDIGLANIPLALQVLYVAGKREWRNKHGGCAHILSYLIHQLCNSTQSRTLDDALYVAEYHPDYQEQRLIYSGMDETELYKLFLDQELNVIEQVLVCRFLCGSRYSSQILELQKRNPNILYDLAKAVGLPAPYYELLKLSKSQEYFTALLPCLMAYEQASDLKVIEEDIDPAELIAGLPAYTYDRHTRTGKQAFRRVLDTQPEINEFLKINATDRDPVNLIGWAVFILEGQILNERLTFKVNEHIRTQAAEAWLYSGGLPIDAQKEFLKLIVQHRHDIDRARQDIR